MLCASLLNSDTNLACEHCEKVKKQLVLTGSLTD